MALIIGAFMIDLLFDLVPDDNRKYSFFPFFHGYDGWDGKMTLQNYVYGYTGNVFRMMIFKAAHILSRGTLWFWLVWLEFGDLVDYALRYNYTWFSVAGLDFEYTTFKTLAVIYLTVRKYGNPK